MDETKRCRKCGVEKPTTEFYHHKGSTDGFQPYCKDCAREYNRKSLKIGGGKRNYNDPDNPLSSYTDRQLMLELRRRGWYGELKKLVQTNIMDL